MEDNKTKYIESSLAAFRAIKSFVFQKGAYPGNFDNGTWKEEDYEDPGYRRVMREDFDDYVRLLVFLRKQYAQALCDAVPHIESEYDNLVINSRNLDQAVKLFRKKFDEVFFVIEWKWDINKIIGNYLLPLENHDIISREESNLYQDLICDIGLIHCQAVNAVCDVFDMERPWNKNRPDAPKITASQTESTEKTESKSVDDKPSQAPIQTAKEQEAKVFKHQIPAEFADYFTAPFKGIGPGNIDNYSKLVSSLTDAARKRSVIEYARIAHLIYNSSKMLQRKKPNTFSGWYQYFCKIVGCEYNEEYKPSKLSITKSLKQEFNYMLD